MEVEEKWVLWTWWWKHWMDLPCWPFSTLNFLSRPKPAPKPKPKPLEIIPDEPRKLSDPAVKPIVRKLPQRKLSEVLPLTQPPTYDSIIVALNTSLITFSFIVDTFSPSKLIITFLHHDHCNRRLTTTNFCSRVQSETCDKEGEADGPDAKTYQHLRTRAARASEKAAAEPEIPLRYEVRERGFHLWLVSPEIDD